MKCVMSLLFLYFLVVIMMKAIIFTKQIKLLYAKAKADMPDMPVKIPGMESKDDGLPVISNETKAKLAAAAAQKIVSDKIASVPGGAALNASTAYTKDLFMNMFSEEKLAKVMTNMAMVPMFCILITFCRLRARVDLETEPQDQAKLWMLISTICLFVQVRQPLDSRLWLHVNIQPYCPPYTYPVQRGLRYPFANLSARSP